MCVYCVYTYMLSSIQEINVNFFSKLGLWEELTTRVNTMSLPLLVGPTTPNFGSPKPLSGKV